MLALIAFATVVASECGNVSPHDHAPFMREDLAFGITGVDCQGDPVRTELEPDTSNIREIQSECPWDPHGHPPFLRSDLAYDITGRDCAGSPLEPWNQ